MVKIDLNKPMKEILAQLTRYPIKTRLSLSGPMIVARDLAHAKLRERLEKGQGLPDYFKNHPVYYAGPAKTPAGYASGAFGPTTAGRMDSFVADFQKAGGSMVMLAKGNRSPAVREACKAVRRLLSRLDRRRGREPRRALHQEGRDGGICRARHGGDLADRGGGFPGLHRDRRQGQRLLQGIEFGLTRGPPRFACRGPNPASRKGNRRIRSNRALSRARGTAARLTYAALNHAAMFACAVRENPQSGWLGQIFPWRLVLRVCARRILPFIAVGLSAIMPGLVAPSFAIDRDARQARPYYVEFRARPSNDIGHSVIVYGRLGASGQPAERNFASFVPGVDGRKGMIFPIYGSVRASQEDIHTPPMTSYQRTLTAAEYARVTQTVRQLKARDAPLARVPVQLQPAPCRSRQRHRAAASAEHSAAEPVGRHVAGAQRPLNAPASVAGTARSTDAIVGTGLSGDIT